LTREDSFQLSRIFVTEYLQKICCCTISGAHNISSLTFHKNLDIYWKLLFSNMEISKSTVDNNENTWIISSFIGSVVVVYPLPISRVYLIFPNCLIIQFIRIVSYRKVMTISQLILIAGSSSILSPNLQQRKEKKIFPLLRIYLF
jgi:hypothetical protein